MSEIRGGPRSDLIDALVEASRCAYRSSLLRCTASAARSLRLLGRGCSGLRLLGCGVTGALSRRSLSSLQSLCGDIVANPIPEEYVPAILPHPWRVVLPGCSSALKLILRMSVNGGGLRLASTVIDKG